MIEKGGRGSPLAAKQTPYPIPDMIKTPLLSALLLGASLTSITRLHAAQGVSLMADYAQPIREIPADFCGLSFETRVLLPDAEGNHYFSPQHQALVAAFRQLGIKSLRVGGNTAERASVPIPDEADIDALFGFARAAGIQVIYTVRMDGNEPAEAARIVRYIDAHYRDLVDCYIVGNEPDKSREYDTYYQKWQQFVQVINAQAFVPEAKFCAPATTDGHPHWPALMAEDEAETGRLQMLAQHYYAGGGSGKFNDRPLEARANMISLSWHDRYEDLYQAFVPAVLEYGPGFRLEETNSFSSGGVHGASDTFAATLWGLDYLYWWAGHDAKGINFHCGQKVFPGDEVVRKNVYTALTAVDDGVQVLPLGYGIRAFQLAAQGNELIPLEVADAPPAFQAYCTRDAKEGYLYFTLLNGRTGADAEDYVVHLPVDDQIAGGAVMELRSPDNQAGAEEGLTL
ncbi:MAG: hypothetical protein E1N59_1509, partial [Puniceicoccaceae bacterium 5H]